ncbi:DsbA family protein [Leisingera aquaemixtae]|uniref:DsbA family protein n=1 Tax=Leisingera aquaemixtae TaxID=1396826 RepID=A0ABY5WF20_9RHOB|nr:MULTISPECIES: DsbA family protein [Leisingera]EDZ45328.1 dsba oxidoreductase [Rhodobacterales bacterium Y4I]UWQ23431.1 DsbA family protein [Leisingera aquaemixtae]UWQ35954.1 DsbA family protein [Leisingera aquaemixtae]UWQ40045.1 DsbA family protein [Leisingera aquaemixtae]UWQ44316.1 DsbA family protein [Leisingera aquaemixtae]
MTPFTRTATAAAAALALLGAPAQAFDISAMSDAEREAFGEQVREYILANPELILEAVDLLEERQQQAEAARDDVLVADNLEELQNDGYSWVGGNPDGDITLVEFMDYRCGYCRRAAPEVEKLLESDGNIRLVIKEFPILGEASVLSSRFAVATKQVAGDDAYKQVHDALIAFGGEPNEVALRRLAEGLSLDADPIFARMDSEEVTAELRQTRELAQKMAISGTPTFVLGTELLRGYLPADQMEIMVAEIREKQS